MKTRTKTFHIGEYCLYGTIIAQIKDTYITLRVCDFKTKNARITKKFHFVDKWKMQEFLWDITSDYYADKVMQEFYA